MNITSVLLCSNWKKRLDTSAVLASGYDEKGKTFKNRSKSVNVQCQIIKVFSVQTIMHIEHTKGLTNYSKVVKYSQKYPICCQAAFNSQLFPTQSKHTHVCANSPHLVILQQGADSPLLSVHFWAAWNSSLPHLSHHKHRLDKFKPCSPVASAGEPRVGLIIKVTFPSIAETLVPKRRNVTEDCKELLFNVWQYIDWTKEDETSSLKGYLLCITFT